MSGAHNNGAAEHEFRLFAPNNNKANLIADFTDWQDVAMEKGDDGWFRVNQTLPDGTYEYRFRVQTKSWFFTEDEWKTVADPRATNVREETQNAVLTIKNGAAVVDDYVWQHDDVPLPENDKLVIYEMHVGDFSGGEEDGFRRGKYTDVVAKLNYLADLGINAIELMPLKSNPGDFNWGYSPVHYFAPEESYGSTAELKELIDKCHELGIRVIVDGVYHHASTSCPLTEIDHDYWFYHEGRNPEQNWGPEFNFEYVDERFGFCPALDLLVDSVRYWILEYRIDGVRFDAARQLNNFDALRAFVASGREMSAMKPFFTVAEYIPPDPAVTEPTGPVESCWNDGFMYAMIEYLTGDSFNLEKIKDAVDPRRLGYASATNVTNYLANHDQNRLFRKLGEHGILDEELYRRARLGVLILMTAVGIPMIWMGEEFGEHALMSEASNKIDWTLLENDSNKDFFEYYRDLIRLRTTHGAFHADGLEFFHDNVDAGVLAFHRFDEDGNEAVVVLNLSDNDLVGYEIDAFPLSDGCREYTKLISFHLTHSTLTVDLKRREGLIFVRD